ncbi:HAD-IA family hydrolase, partial [Streptomyces alkaliphilus]
MTTVLPAGGGSRRAAEPAPHAVLLDMDGTLVDTEDFWWDAEVRVFAELGHTLREEDRRVVVGGPMTRSATYLIEVTGADIAYEELAERLNAAFLARLDLGVALMPGAAELLADLARHRVPAALVSASHREVVDRMLRAIGAEHFALTIAGDDLTRTKPHPDPYLTAAIGLGADPTACVAVEDTATGVASAEAAGCRVLAVPSIAALEPAPGRTVVDSLRGVDLEFLRGLWAEPLPPAPPGAGPAPGGAGG